jgi:hypothetical protein
MALIVEVSQARGGTEIAEAHSKQWCPLPQFYQCTCAQSGLGPLHKNLESFMV